MSQNEDYAYMTEMIHRINQDVDILRLKNDNHEQLHGR